MRHLLVAVVLCSFFSGSLLAAQSARVLPPGEVPRDARLGPLKTLNGYFPFHAVATPAAWKQRAAQLRRQVLVATGLWPLPTKTPLRAVVHSPVDRDDYTVWRVYFESLPGHFVTGSLYRPKNRSGRLPAVLCPHGHWPDGRFQEQSLEKVKQQISIGAERFLVGGRYPVQARCVQLARMGCVVFQYDMVGYADSVQLEHRPGVRKAMNTPTNWGYFSPQAELHLENMMGLQTWNSIRAVDFLTSLPEVDPQRIAVTGASGGGTQTFMLLAVDDRPAAGLPFVMVSTAMQGGCTCENATYLRIGAGNIDLAALCAPRPLALTAAHDWTQELKTKGFPDLQSLYKMLGREGQIRAAFHTNFQHNYNSVNRMFMYGCVNDFLGLGFQKPILERDFVPLSRAELTVWTDDHPRPSGKQVGDAHERALLRWWTQEGQQKIEALREKPDQYRRVVGGAWDVLLGDRLDDVGQVEMETVKEFSSDGYQGSLLMLKDPAHDQQLPAMVFYPADWNGEAVLWLTDQGKAGLLSEAGKPLAAIQKLLDGGFAVMGVDLLDQGEFLPDGGPLTHARLLQPTGKEPWQKAAAYTFGYNRPLFAQRVHDILNAIRAIEKDPRNVQRIHLVGVGREAGPLALAARAQADDAIAKTVVHTAGFHFAAVDRLDDPMFLPGAVKYDDLEGLKRLCGDAPVWIEQGPSAEQVAAAIASRLTQ